MADAKYEYRLEEFINDHRHQLITSGIPEIFWASLHRKLMKEEFDAGNVFSMMNVVQTEEDDDDGGGSQQWKVIVTGRNGVAADNPNNVFLIDHMWTYDSDLSKAKDQLLSLPQLLIRLARLMNLSDYDSPERLATEALQQCWRYNQTYNVSGSLPLWYVPDEFGARVQHSSSPTCRMVPFFFLPRRESFSILWPVRDLTDGQEVSRDFVEYIRATTSDEDTVQACLLPWFHRDMTHVHPRPPDVQVRYFSTYKQNETLPDLVALSSVPSIRDRPSPITVFSQYSFVNQYLKDPRFKIVDREEDATILWFADHFKDYELLSRAGPGKLVNQFPYESVLTIKDLLAIVCRGRDPKWLPETFNLKTEMANFVSRYQRRARDGLDNVWIVKPWNLARGLDVHITDDVNQVIRMAETGPKLASKYVERPVLIHMDGVGDVKFDLRFIVLLTSVRPLIVHIYDRFWIRYANKPFVLDAFADYETHMTVMNYDEDVPMSNVLCDRFVRDFQDQWKVDWSVVEEDVRRAIRESLECAVGQEPPAGVAHSPQSRAVYGVDVLLAWDGDVVQPKILEYNFMPDCRRACLFYPTFYDDVFSTLFLDDVDGRPVTRL